MMMGYNDCWPMLLLPRDVAVDVDVSPGERYCTIILQYSRWTIEITKLMNDGSR